MSKVIVHGKDGKVQSEENFTVQRRYRLLKDFVIPAGTELCEVEDMVHYKPACAIIGLSKDSIMSCSVFEDGIKDRPDLFEEIKE